MYSSEFEKGHIALVLAVKNGLTAHMIDTHVSVEKNHETKSAHETKTASYQLQLLQ